MDSILNLSVILSIAETFRESFSPML